jgi:molybdate transport system ATP-binding protein
MLALEAGIELGALELDVALRVEHGSCLALAGASGAGKTSVLRIVAGLLQPARGRVTCSGQVWLDTDRRLSRPPEGRRCGYLFQEYALFPHMRAWENVAYPLRDLSREERRRRAHELLDRFGVGSLAEVRPRTLSGGERQRVALARALARRPHALLLDEPLAALDATSRAHASRELAALLRESEAPALLVTHDFGEAALLGDTVAVIDKGRVVQVGPASELVATPGSAFVADFTGAVVLHGSARGETDGLTIVELDGGGRVASTEAGEGPVAVTVHPWEISLEPSGHVAVGSALNRLEAEVVSVTPVGNRVRVGLTTPQPLTAELTDTAVRTLALSPGGRTVACFKATATRLVAR